MADPKFEVLRVRCAERPHGTRLRYVGGCRCVPCRAANSRYETGRALARASGDWNGIVSATRARQHIERLSAAGVGGKALSAASGVPYSIVCRIKDGRQLKIRARTEARILAVDEAAIADGALVDAGRARRMVQELVQQGYTKAQMAQWMGYKRPVLQFLKTRHITARTASRVERMVALLRAGKLRRDR